MQSAPFECKTALKKQTAQMYDNLCYSKCLTWSNIEFERFTGVGVILYVNFGHQNAISSCILSSFEYKVRTHREL